MDKQNSINSETAISVDENGELNINIESVENIVFIAPYKYETYGLVTTYTRISEDSFKETFGLTTDQYSVCPICGLFKKSSECECCSSDKVHILTEDEMIDHLEDFFDCIEEDPDIKLSINGVEIDFE